MNLYNFTTMYKSLLLLAMFAVSSMTFSAQTRADAIQKTLSERFELAESELNTLIAKEPAVAENYAAAGYNYFYWGVSDQDDANDLAEKMASAEKCFRKGTEVAPTNPLNYVGLGHLAAFRGDVSSTIMSNSKKQ